MESTSNFITIKYDQNPSPWQSTYVNIKFNKDKLQPVVDDILNECKDKNYTASYMYDRDVDRALKNHNTSELGSIRPLLIALSQVISEQCPSDCIDEWHNEYVASRRSIESKIAWSKPGFAEARSYNDIYGWF